MKSIASRILGTLVVLSLVGCGSNDSAPSVDNITLSSGSVAPGSVVTVNVTFRVSASASNTPAGLLTDPFSAVILLPIGASYVPGSANILFQSGVVPPDSQGSCAGGVSYLMYNFGVGAFEDPYHFKNFATVLALNTVVSMSTNSQEVTAAAMLDPFTDPCSAPSEAIATFGVSSTPVAPTPTPSFPF